MKTKTAIDKELIERIRARGYKQEDDCFDNPLIGHPKNKSTRVLVTDVVTSEWNSSSRGALKGLQDEIRKYKEFSNFVENIWNEPLELLEAQTILATRMAFFATEELLNYKELQQADIQPIQVNISLAKGVLRLFNRAILAALEICHLLRGGYPFGAKARFRLLYELEIISAFMMFVSKTKEGKNIGQGYVEYEEVEEFRSCEIKVKSLESYIKQLNEKLTEIAPGPDRQKILRDLEKFKKLLSVATKDRESAKANVDKLKSKYKCKNFDKQYGWAKPFANINTFKDIQNDVDRAWGILWTEGSIEVHGSAAGSSFPKNSPQDSCMCIGPTDLAFAEIISDTSIALETLAYTLAEAMQSKELLLCAHTSYSLTSLSQQRLPLVLAKHPMANKNPAINE
jgi:hypothetical protein